ncbi:methyltransferase domain-containing protein [Uliginosibacterium gangwonense]|uniref:methyltransferase domain-containing protein n=1 Tax=Uliginosibacterium gangwonense TaxID=392736 RepID=UPI000381320D|nr:methyltransferase domain-containing protein [Uliginosibacterium gangwonense]
MAFDYATVYDNYWASGDRFGEQSFADADALAEEIILSCGGGRILDIGSGMGQLVRALLRLGVDAHGVDVSQLAVDHANLSAPERFHKASVLHLPFKDGAFDTVVSTDCLEHLSEEDVVQSLREIRRVSRRAVYFRIATTIDRDGHWHLTVKPRAWWEQRFFEAGFRKHPSYYQVNDYELLEHDGWQITVLLECIPEAAASRYPIAALAAERDLHMDMLRETGARSDAHVARYQWATQFIRPGDTVLDAACGLGYGSYILQCASTAKSTLGIDGSEYAIDYAVRNFSSDLSSLKFRCGMLPDGLAEISDHSVDVVVSFETLEHIEENIKLLAEFHRVLTPGGRIITSVPNDWSDETGEDPNPFHVHVYTLDRLRKELESSFILEMLVAQTANQYKVGPERKTWQSAGRSLKQIPLTLAKNGTEPNAEWWLAVAMRSPLDGAAVPYRETAYPTFSTPSWNVTTFSRDYQNPWLVRSMVDTGHRLRDPSALIDLAEQVIVNSPSDTPDVGAALCVIAYQLSFSGNAHGDEIESLEHRIEAYLEGHPKTPHGVRWSVSLLFVLGKLWIEQGAFSKAKLAFERCISIDALAFSPLLCNRTVEACLILGLLCIGNKDHVGAIAHWRKGIAEARRAVAGSWDVALGDIDNPAEFGLPEIASILEYASSCAFALANVHEIENKPWWWIHPRRDRLSQIRKISRDLQQTRLGFQQAQNELRRYASQAEEFARQVRTQQDTLALMQEAVTHKDGELAAYQEQAEEFAKQVRAQHGTLALTQETIKHKDGELAAYQEQAEEFAKQVRAQQGTLALTQETITHKDGELAAYQEQAEEFARQVRALQDTLALTQETITHKDGELAAYQEQAEEFARQVRALQDTLALMQEAITHKDGELAAYQEQAEEFARQVRAQQDALVLMQEAITHKDGELAAYQQQVEEFAEQIRTQQDALGLMQETVTHKDGELMVYGKQVAEFSRQLTCVSTELEDRQAEIRALTQQLAEREQVIIAMEDSPSWRLTKPFRVIAQFIRRREA